MKKHLLLPLLLVTLAGPGFAQGQKQDINKMEVQGIPIPVYVESQTQQMSKDLGLSAAQTKSLHDANTDIAIRTYNAEHAGDAAKIKDAKNAVATYRSAQYQKILTPKQYTTWAQAASSSQRMR